MTTEKNEKEVSTQIRWSLLGRVLTANVPFAEGEININIDEVHESWADYIKVYGICQSTKDEIASASYSNPDLRAQIASAKAAKDEGLEKELKEEYKALRIEYLKKEAANIRTALWKSVVALKSQKPAKKEGAAKESRAQIEARVKAETIEKMKAGFRAIGLTEEQIEMAVKGV